MGVLDHDEIHVKDCALILEDHSKYLPNIKEDPVETVIWGDGLSCKRVKDAQAIRQTGGNRWRKLCAFIPAAQDWHKRVILLQVNELDILQKTRYGFSMMATMMTS